MKDKKYVSLYEEIKKQIASGEYRPHQRLPSKRITAERLGLSLITVAAAYAMLEDEGYISARERSGYFVNDIGHLYPHPIEQSSDRPSPDADPIPDRDPDFEYSVWFKTVRKVMADKGSLLFVKSPAMGCAVLRNAIADYLYRARGIVADPRNIVIGSGAEQLYETAVKLLGRDRIFGIEDPCYEQIPSVLCGMGVEVCRLRMGEDGIESPSLWGSRFDVLHVTPYHSFPTGVTASIAKRHEYLRWATETGNYILEDDFDSEFYLSGHPMESLYNPTKTQSVIYLNTFSKSLSPSMRMGYMILPEALMERYRKTLGGFSCTVPVAEQYFLAEFIESGSFERHLNRKRRRLSRG